MKKQYIPILVSALTASLVAAQVIHNNATKEPASLPASDVTWDPLNPARGEKGPKAANLWNDRTEEPASGFLVAFKDGFSSPPHIHNVTYRGVVISGEVHNDDPDAEEMWMPQGAFWTQPAGQVHITSAKGKNVVAYIEIDSGPYLVMPKEKAFDKGERPINVDPSNLVWLDASQHQWIERNTSSTTKSPQIAVLWGEPSKDKSTFGSFLRIPAGFSGELSIKGDNTRVVVVDGTLNYGTASENELTPGGYLGLNDENKSINLSNKGDQTLTLYLRSNSEYKLIEKTK